MNKLLILIAAAAFLAQTAKAIEPLDPRFLKALNQVEASGKHGNILGDNGKALGGYQIHRIYWTDACLFDKRLLAGKYTDVSNQAYAERTVTAYLNRYALTAIKQGDYSTLARVHNGGPNGPKNKATLAYAQKIQSLMLK